MLTVQEVQDEVSQIAELVLDPEVAHINEDNLWHKVLSHIATGECDDPVLLATAALQTGAIAFPRWYA